MSGVSAQHGFHPGVGQTQGRGNEEHGVHGMHGGHQTHGTQKGQGVQDRFGGYSLGEAHPHSDRLMGLFHQLHQSLGTFGGGQQMTGGQGFTAGRQLPMREAGGQPMVNQGQGMPGGRDVQMQQNGGQPMTANGQGMPAGRGFPIQGTNGQDPAAIVEQFARMGQMNTSGLMDGGSHFGHEQQLSTMQTPFGEAQFGRDAQFSITQNAQMVDISQFANVPGQNGTAQFGRHTLEQNFANPLQPNNPARFMSDLQFTNVPSAAGQMTYNRLEQAAEIPGMGSSHTLAEYENLPAGVQFSGFPQANSQMGLQAGPTQMPSQIQQQMPVQNLAQGVVERGMTPAPLPAPAAMPPAALVEAVFNGNNNSVTDGRFTVTLDPADTTKVHVHDAQTNTSITISGDPHLVNSAGDKASFQKVPLVATLDNGGRLVFTPGQPNAQGLSTLAQVQFTERGQTATLSNLSGAPGTATFSTDMTKQAALPTNAVFLTTGQKGFDQLYIAGKNQPQNNQLTDTKNEQNLDEFAVNTQAS